MGKALKTLKAQSRQALAKLPLAVAATAALSPAAFADWQGGLKDVVGGASTIMGTALILVAAAVYVVTIVSSVWGLMKVGESIAQKSQKIEQMNFYKVGGAIVGFLLAAFALWAMDKFLSGTSLAELSPSGILTYIIGAGKGNF